VINAFNREEIWTAHLIPNIKIFRQLTCERLPSGDKVNKRCMVREIMSLICHEEATRGHIFFLASLPSFLGVHIKHFRLHMDISGKCTSML
jgi:hypothetical protein